MQGCAQANRDAGMDKQDYRHWAHKAADWGADYLESWQPKAEFIHAAQVGYLDVDVAELAGEMPQDERLALPGAAEFKLPVTLGLPHEGSLLLETEGPGREAQEVLDVRRNGADDERRPHEAPRTLATQGQNGGGVGERVGHAVTRYRARPR